MNRRVNLMSAGVTWPIVVAITLLSLGVFCGAVAVAGVPLGQQSWAIVGLILTSAGSGAVVVAFTRTPLASSNKSAISPRTTGPIAAVELANSAPRFSVMLPRLGQARKAAAIAVGTTAAAMACLAVISPSIVILAAAVTGVSLYVVFSRGMANRGLPLVSTAWRIPWMGIALACLCALAISSLLGSNLLIGLAILGLLGAPLAGRWQPMSYLRSTRIPRGVAWRLGGVLAACVVALMILVGQDLLPAESPAGLRQAFAQNTTGVAVPQQPLAAEASTTRTVAEPASSLTIAAAAGPSFMDSSLSLTHLALLGIVAVVAARYLKSRGLTNSLRAPAGLFRLSPSSVTAVILLGLVAAVLFDPGAARSNLPNASSANAVAVSANTPQRELLRNTIVQKEAELSRLRKAMPAASAAGREVSFLRGDSLEIIRVEKELADARLRLAEIDAARQISRTRSATGSDVDMDEWGATPPGGTAPAER
jgi:hypothetical protein